MKPNRSRLHPGRLQNNPRGFSLILVLLILALLSVLVLSFFIGVTTDLSSTTAFANGSGTRGLSDNVIQLMEGQIKDATTAPVDSNGVTHSYATTPTQPFAWASQPGMIRTYDTTGAGLMFYKLYSSDNMRTVWNDSGTYQSSLKDDLLTSDMADPSQFTDLNSPVNDSSGKAVYPIADPISLPGGGNPVQGFAVNPPDSNPTPPPSAPTNVAGVTYAAGTSLPMPVRWLYKLQDGTLVAAPSGGTSGTVDLHALGASASNPIVGRVAFWTDDETSKVNINTAAEGTYWDTPRFDGTTQVLLNVNTPPLTSASTTVPYPDPEYAYAVSQPLKYEFQRYPGHPAQVALSPIFPNLLTEYSTPRALANAMAQITPFLAVGGSEGGTYTLSNVQNQHNGAVYLSAANRKSPYASVDEFLYSIPQVASPTRTLTDPAITPTTLQASKFFITANSRAPELNLFGKPRIACWPISSQFSLTSSPSTNKYTSVFDRLIAFCSSLNTGTSAAPSYQPYYFQRNQPNPFQPNPLLPGFSNDYSSITRNQTLYAYLQNLTGQAVPGFGGGTTGFLAKYPANPANVGNPTATDRDQILTEIFDYIRCTDICDANVFALNPANTFAGSFFDSGNGVTVNDTYPITPIQIKNPNNGSVTMGFGRVSVIYQVGLCLICLVDGSNINYTTSPATTTIPYTKTLTPNVPYPEYGNIIVSGPPVNPVLSSQFNGMNGQLGSNQKIVQAIFLMQGFVPGNSPPAFTPCEYYQIKGLSNITFNDGGTTHHPFIEPAGELYNTTNAPFLATDYGGKATYEGTELSLVHYCISNPGNPNQNIGDYMNPKTTFTYTTPNVPVIASSNPGGGHPYYYPCISQPFVVNSLSGALTVTTSSPITISMLSGNTSGGKLILPVSLPPGNTTLYGTPYQTFSFPFPKQTMTLPIPVLESETPPGSIPISAQWGFQRRISEEAVFKAAASPYQIATESYFKLCGVDDSMKSFFLVDHGDWRLLNASAAPTLTPTPIYEKNGSPDPNYTSSAGFGSSSSLPYSNYFRYTTMIPANSNRDLSSSYIPNLPTPPSQIYNNVYPVDTTQPPPQQLALAHGPVTPWSGDPTNSPDSQSQNCFKNGDFDNAEGYWPDGPQINKVDEGDSSQEFWNGQVYAPYYNWYSPSSSSLSFSTPNRIMPSPGMFGSLSTGVISNTPWQTLLFRPQPAINGANQVSASSGPGVYYAHTEAAVPAYQDTGYNEYTTKLPDHLFMDLFWMPVVEPYAISDSFSTAGKINMNYQIEPFSYIDRSTSLICLLKAEKIIAVPDTADYYYKGVVSVEPATPKSVFRFPIYTLNANGTSDETGGSLRQFKARFDAGDIFRSASEICDIFLVPCNADGTPPSPLWTSDTNAASYWASHRLTGDNSRERPYTNLYGRLTTKSNTFTIHMRVQSLKQSPADRAAGKWVESTDAIVGEYRGSTLIERYLDPSQNLASADYGGATPPATGNLDSFYKFRVVRSTQFVP
jgi:hypothetical protein